MNQKPHLPLPFKVRLGHIMAANNYGVVCEEKYLVHAANAYPKLVECLKSFVGGWEGREAENLLIELGECE